MGYTHYWTQTRDLTADEFADVTADVREILSYVENMLGVPLGNAWGKRRTHPLFETDAIYFNGIGDNSHESFSITRKRQRQGDWAQIGSDFCKTARKPYDVAVTACLCYLATCLEEPAYTVSSDGNGRNFLDGLEAARQALPRKANILDIPMDILREDRWTGPWVSGTPDDFEVRFCVNGKGYVLHKGESYCFETHRGLGEFLMANKQAVFRHGGNPGNWGIPYGRVEPDIWRASGSFDKARHDRIKRAQRQVLARLFPVPVEHAEQPPAYVRPGDLPRPEEAGTFCYDLADLIKRADAA